MADTVTRSASGDAIALRDHATRVPAAEKNDDSHNVGNTERLLSIAGGAALAIFGASRRSPAGVALAALGGGLLYRGATGHCTVYEALNVNTSDDADIDAKGVHVERSVTIGKSPDELYRFWRDFENLPNFMAHLKSVRVTGPKTSHWVACGPAGRSVEWDAEIINEVENELIAWRSVGDPDVENAGSVRFAPAPGDRGCIVSVTLQYYPPAGAVGQAVAKLFGEEPLQQVSDDLRRFQRLMETGEIPTTDGQPRG